MKRTKKSEGLQHYFDLIANISIKVDNMWASMQAYQEEQTLNSGKLSDHDDRIEKIEDHLNLPSIT